MTRWTLAAAVAVVTMVAALWPQGSGAICPYCTCPASYDLVCARRKDNGAVRGFSSRCVLDCSNKCRPPSRQFVFLKKGRCGDLRPKPKPTVGGQHVNHNKTTTTTTKSPRRLK